MDDMPDMNCPMRGDRIKVVVAPHMAGQDEGIVRQVVEGALGIEFDSAPGVVHQWYVPSEVMVIEPAVAPANEDQPVAAPAASRPRSASARNAGRVFHAITAEIWAIVPSELQKISAIAQRHSVSDPALKEGEPAYLKRDYQIMAGPGAQKLPGAQRAFVIDGVAILPVTGPIFPRANMMTEMSGATSITMLQNDHRAAMANPEIGAILMLMDTPGGAVSGIAAFSDQVAAGAKKKPTTAYVSGMAASAGYWIASAASEIVMDRTAAVGSIGVVAALPVQVAPDSNGEVWIDIVSSNAPNKRPDAMSESGRAEIVSTLDAIEQQFVADIAKGRNVSTAKVISDFGQGGIKIGSDGVKAGMADKVQSYETTLNGLRRSVANQRRLTALKP